MAHKEMTIDSVRRALIKGEWVIILKEEGTERYLPIYVGPSQANIVKRELIGGQFPENEIYEYFLAGRDMEGSELESVAIDGPEKSYFHARLFLSQDGNSLLVDCPVAGALALGFRREARILVDERSFLEAGLNLSN